MNFNIRENMKIEEHFQYKTSTQELTADSTVHSQDDVKTCFCENCNGHFSILDITLHDCAKEDKTSHATDNMKTEQFSQDETSASEITVNSNSLDDVKTKFCEKCNEHFFIAQFVLHDCTKKVKTSYATDNTETEEISQDETSVRELATDCSVHLQDVKTIFCEKCNEHFSIVDSALHKCTKKDKISSACQKCKKKFSSSKGMKLNNLIHTFTTLHKGKPPYTCEKCHKQYTTLIQLKHHLNSHSKPKNKACNRQFSSFTLRNDHMNTHSKKVQYSCGICNRRYFSISILNIHLRKHSGSNPGVKNVCEICSKQFYSSFSLRCHLLSHTYKKLIYCDFCDKKFTLQSSLNHHAKTHVEAISQSSLNSVKTRTEVTLQLSLNHQAKTQLDANSKRNLNLHDETHAEVTLQTSPNHHAKICAETTSELSLNNHAKTHTEVTSQARLNNRAKTDTEVNSHICELCERQFLRWSSLKQHLKSHEKVMPYSCKQCPNKFKHLSSLKSHIRSHAKKNKYCCNICSESFYSAEQLDIHLCSHAEEGFRKKIHRVEILSNNLNSQKDLNMLKCRMCSKNCDSLPDLKTHSCKIAKKRSYHCKECKEQFPSAALLRHHFLTHSGDKLYTCNVCPKQFSTAVQLEYHARVHCMQLGCKKQEKLYACSVCPKKLSTAEQLEYHARLHFIQLGCKKQGELYACTVCPKLFSAPAEMEYHLRVHSIKLGTPRNNSKQLIYCKVCKAQFSSTRAFNVHLLNKKECDEHGKKLNASTVFQKKFSTDEELDLHTHSKYPEEKLVSCKLCKIQLISKEALKHHLLQKKECKESYSNKFTHPPKGKRKCKNIRPKFFTCTVCGKKFATSAGLENHTHIHSMKIYMCDICGTQCSTFELFNEHLSQHPKNELISCKVCKLLFTSSKALKEHVLFHERKNTSSDRVNKPHTCSVCQKQFTTSAGLKNHAYIHSVKKGTKRLGHKIKMQYTCDICGIFCSTFTSFNEHLREHPKNELISCETCKLQVTSIRALEKHQLLHEKK